MKFFKRKQDLYLATKNQKVTSKNGVMFRHVVRSSHALFLRATAQLFIKLPDRAAL